MRGIAFSFFFAATIYVTIGMVWGIVMAASGDHTLAPAHAHLNLVGWVTMALFGIYYHLVPAAAEGKMAKLHFALATAGLFILVPGIAMAISGGGEIPAKIGSTLTLLSMVVFAVTVFRNRQI
jgi:dolichyl-phosphate-mannose--protein O-mannosyl transferase